MSRLVYLSPALSLIVAICNTFGKLDINGDGQLFLIYFLVLVSVFSDLSANLHLFWEVGYLQHIWEVGYKRRRRVGRGWVHWRMPWWLRAGPPTQRIQSIIVFSSMSWCCSTDILPNVHPLNGSKVFFTVIGMSWWYSTDILPNNFWVAAVIASER